MPLSFMFKVQYLCKRINNVEWSGVLFYDMKGTIDKPSTCIITLTDILLMDIGTGSYTEYAFDESVVEYMMDNSSLMSSANTQNITKHKGHIHSHNVMRTFFSGTDMDEIKENSEFYNFYLSFIVNNVIDCTAKIAFRGKEEASSIKAKNQQGKEYIIKNAVPVAEKVFTYDCDIKYPGKVPDSLIEKTNKIVKQHNTKIKEQEKKQQVQSQQQKQQPFIQSGLLPKSSWSSPELKNGIWSGIEEVDVIDIITDEDYDFVAFLLRMGNIVIGADGHDSIENALEDLAISQTEGDMPIALINSFMELHNKFYQSQPMAETMSFILDSITKVISILEENEEDYHWLTKAILMFRSFGNQLSIPAKK